jgi:hypothetical protein
MKRITALLLLALASPAAAQDRNCGTEAEVVALLSGKFNEQPIFLGLSSNVLFRLWLSPNSGTFTVTVTSASGTTCITASGRGGEVFQMGIDG